MGDFVRRNVWQKPRCPQCGVFDFVVFSVRGGSPWTCLSCLVSFGRGRPLQVEDVYDPQGRV